ncbi:ribosome maturation factor RimP [Desulfoscipio geothermicus]|uniref:Ribosome maturation factor RimP n=1 Tax=Desulfoscipio geothermicus DSM 3669 TaxID=1121426 RepID=A0A1I6D8L5_9FIRM|nr:ribosome maturation factor RimP [Desulfoscipio geothermicus]SFR01697.1 ribosome maturation factor RimP [Desulfoscipio geothermicus DSM 3669]
MNKGKVVSTVEKIVASPIAELGMELVDIEYVKEGGRWFLRVFIDKPGGVGLEDCQRVSESIDPLLDATDPIPHSYTLEVSSPGLNRPLKKLADFERFTGEKISLTTYVPVENRRKFKGKLIAASNHAVTLDVDGNSVVIPMEQVAFARLAAEL